jgi:nicotinamide-nucleotide amidase
MQAEVIAIGDELTTGQRLDTNSQWISAELGLLGVPVHVHTTVGDTLEAGIEAFGAAAGRSDIVVATGGLGPTADDLTRDVLAAVAGQPLESSAEALAAVAARFARRGVAMPESNLRQALFPRGSRIIPNPQGTAPGIDIDLVGLDGHRCRVIALPGVPAELKTMWGETVAPALAAMLPEAGVFVHRLIKCFGAGESAVEAMLPDLIRRGRDPLVGITVHEATITLRIVARGHDAAECRAKIAPTEETIRRCLGSLVFGTDDEEVEDAALRVLADAGLTLGTAEAGTEGRLAACLARAEARRQAGSPARAAAGAAAVARTASSRTVFRGGKVLSGPMEAEVGELADRARIDTGAVLGLAVGPARPAAEGRHAVDIALADGRHVELVEHMLGGGLSIALSRAAKTAVDLVRTRIASRESRP